MKDPIMLRIPGAYAPRFTRDHVKFLAVCDLTDQIASLNDSKNRKNTAETVRVFLRKKGYTV